MAPSSSGLGHRPFTALNKDPQYVKSLFDLVILYGKAEEGLRAFNLIV